MLNNESETGQLPEFDQLGNLFLEAGAFCSPAEFHGCLCGHLAAGGRYESSVWIMAAAQLMEIAEIRDQALIAALEQVYQVSLGQLSDNSFSFTLLVPQDDTPISLRAEALGQWCHGFLAGYGMAGGRMEEGLSGDAVDALQDMVQISQIAADAEGESSEEADFVEVYEYVRMSAMLIFSECNRGAKSEDPAADKALH